MFATARGRRSRACSATGSSERSTELLEVESSYSGYDEFWAALERRCRAGRRVGREPRRSGSRGGPRGGSSPARRAGGGVHAARARRGRPARPARSPKPREYDRRTMQGRLLRRRGIVTFAVLVACAEVAGRALTRHVDSAFHVTPLARTDTSYYPFLLVGVKAAGAMTLAALAARALRAWAAADAGRRLLAVSRSRAHTPSPRLRPGLSLRVWAAAFGASSLALPRARRHRERRRRPVAVARAVAAHLRAAGVRAARGARRARVAARRFPARDRSVRGPHARAGPQGPRAASSGCGNAMHARPTTTRRRGAASASPSSRVLLRCPPDPRSRPVPAGDALSHRTGGGP